VCHPRRRLHSGDRRCNHRRLVRRRRQVHRRVEARDAARHGRGRHDTDRRDPDRPRNDDPGHVCAGDERIGAAYLEGIKLQEAGNCAEALPRLEAAQKLFSAPTHLLHIGQCQNANGKLVEAAETYETLVRVPLTKDSPEVFHQSQDEGRKELARIKPRIPTLRVQITPAPSSLSSLVVKLNGNAVPTAVLGIARPVNPGKYKVTVWAAGYKEAVETVDVGEGSSKAIELKLSK